MLLPSGRDAILSDTVGFISDLPTQLVAAFRATLEEVTAADVIVHVRDIANPDTAAQKQQVLEVLTDLGILGRDGEDGETPVPMVEVWNKWDLLGPDQVLDLEAEMLRRRDEKIVPLSAFTGDNCQALLTLLSDMLTADAKPHTFVLPASAGQRIAWLHAHGEVLSDEDAGEGDGEPGAGGAEPRRRLTVRLSPRDLGRFARL